MHATGCAKPGSVQLIWLNKVGEPPGHKDHNISYDHDLVEICPACNGATLVRLRHDCLDFESVYDQYEWYELSPDEGARLREFAARCKRPLDPFCTCAVHKSLKASALTLPSSNWDAVFESAAHRRMITIADGRKPAFKLVGAYVAPPQPVAPPPAPAKPLDIKTLLWVMVAWPLTFVASLVLYFRAVDWPFLVDAIVVIVALPMTIVVAGLVVAAIGVLLETKPPGSS